MADPIRFPEQNKVLAPPPETKDYEIAPLPIWTDGEQCVSCWKLSWRERLHALITGRVWCAVLSGRTQPPVSIASRAKYFEPI